MNEPEATWPGAAPVQPADQPPNQEQPQWPTTGPENPDLWNQTTSGEQPTAPASQDGDPTVELAVASGEANVAAATSESQEPGEVVSPDTAAGIDTASPSFEGAVAEPAPDATPDVQPSTDVATEAGSDDLPEAPAAADSEPGASDERSSEELETSGSQLDEAAARLEASGDPAAIAFAKQMKEEGGTLGEQTAEKYRQEQAAYAEAQSNLVGILNAVLAGHIPKIGPEGITLLEEDNVADTPANTLNRRQIRKLRDIAYLTLGISEPTAPDMPFTPIDKDTKVGSVTKSNNGKGLTETEVWTADGKKLLTYSLTAVEA